MTGNFPKWFSTAFPFLPCLMLVSLGISLIVRQQIKQRGGNLVEGPWVAVLGAAILAAGLVCLRVAIVDGFRGRGRREE
jgi:hypothetical protein